MWKIVILFLILGLFFWNIDFTESKDFERTWTTAICEGNKCRDFEVRCLGDEVLSKSPITGFVIFGEDWIDRRENKELC